MKVELIKTKESDGDWYKVYVDGSCEACISVSSRTEEVALIRANQIFDFYIENKGKVQIIKSFEI